MPTLVGKSLLLAYGHTTSMVCIANGIFAIALLCRIVYEARRTRLSGHVLASEHFESPETYSHRL